MRRLLIILALALVACGRPAVEQLEVVHINVDGKEVACVVYQGGYAGGVSCDF